jgi:hypothetical protein
LQEAVDERAELADDHLAVEIGDQRSLVVLFTNSRRHRPTRAPVPVSTVLVATVVPCMTWSMTAHVHAESISHAITRLCLSSPQLSFCTTRSCMRSPINHS